MSILQMLYSKQKTIVIWVQMMDSSLNKSEMKVMMTKKDQSFHRWVMNHSSKWLMKMKSKQPNLSWMSMKMFDFKYKMKKCLKIKELKQKTKKKIKLIELRLLFAISRLPLLKTLETGIALFTFQQAQAKQELLYVQCITTFVNMVQAKR